MSPRVSATSGRGTATSASPTIARSRRRTSRRYCITAPTNAALPGGGGQQICGLYDVVPAKFGLTDNLIALAKHYGSQSEMYNGIDQPDDLDALRRRRFRAGRAVDRVHQDGQLLSEQSAEHPCAERAGIDAAHVGYLPREYALGRPDAVQGGRHLSISLGLSGERELSGYAAGRDRRRRSRHQRAGGHLAPQPQPGRVRNARALHGHHNDRCRPEQHVFPGTAASPT